MQSLPGSLFLVVNVLVVKGEPTRQGFLSHTTLFGPLVQHECSIHGALIISQSCSKSLTEPHYLKHEQQTLHLPHLAFFSMALICFLSLESLGRVKLDFSALTKVTAGFPAAETSQLCCVLSLASVTLQLCLVGSSSKACPSHSPPRWKASPSAPVDMTSHPRELAQRFFL